MSVTSRLVERKTDTIHVLHVDDEPSLADMVATYLEREDERFAVQTATSASEGLDLLAETDFECIISDYDMPGLSGIEFLDAVRTEYPNRPFILYTGTGSEEIASEAISAGVTDYLQKETGTSQYEVLANRVGNAVEQYRSQHIVEDTEQKLSEIANNTDDILFMFSGDWSELLFVNSAYEEIWGGSIETLSADPKSFLEHIHPGDREKARRSMQRLSDGEPDTVEYRINCDGEQRWIRGESKPIIRDGTVSRIVGFVRDITAQKRREQELRDERAFIEQSLDALQDAFFVFSEDGRPLRWNSRIPEVTGYSESEIAEMEPLDFFPEVHHERVASCLQRVLTDGTSEVRADVLTKDEARIPYEFVGTRLTNANGETLGLAGVGRDVTERRKRERELTRTRDLLEQTECIADVGGWEIDGDTMDVFWTEHLFELLGVDCETEPPLDAALDVYHEDDRPIVEGAIENALDTGEPFDIDVRFRRPDDEIRWMRVQGTPTIENGAVTTLRGAVQDITTHKTQEQELQRQNSQLEEFASIVSHDLRNPLNLAHGRLELLQDDVDSEHAEPIEDALGRMERIIEDMLWLAREGERIGSTETVNLHSAIEDAWSIVTDDQDEASLVETGDVQRIAADRDRLQQLLENLFRNAIEHGRSDVTVTVGGLENGFYVADDGPGIPESDREAVFETGYSTSQDGTGFGLNIVKQVADAHGWEISISESSDGGARFEITGL